jgi:protein TonB
MSAVLHGVALAGLCFVVAPRHRPEPPPPPSFAVVMAAPPAPAPVAEQSLDAAKLAAATQVMATRLSVPTALSLSPSVHGEVHAPRRKVPAPAAPAASAQVAATAPATRVAAAVPVAAPPQAGAAAPHDALLGLEARIRQAVQDAAIYPASARVMHVEGRTQVRFDYTDGSVGAADVATPSSSPMLDRAALAAVRRAALPRAPAQVGARKLALLVWVDFRLVRQD